MKKKKKSTAKRIITIVLIVLGILLVADVGISMYFYNVASVRDPNKAVGQTKKTSKAYNYVVTFNTLPKETRTITNDGLKLQAWYVPAATPTDKTVVVVHGFRADKTAMREYGALYHELGYNVLMPDNRGAGDSQGDLISYGYYEKDDTIAWVKSLVAKNPSDKITLFGVSLGGATVMLASGDSALPKQVNSIIEDCGYSNAWDEITYQAWQGYKVPPFPIVYTVSLENKIRQGVFYQDISPANALKKDKLPILLMHGGNDTYVPTYMVNINYAAVPAGVPKEKVIIPKAAHAASFDTNPSLYRATVSNFLAKYNN